MIRYNEEQFDSPQDVIPGYETDLRAVGTNRTADPDTLDDTPWYEHFPKEHVQTVDLPDDAEVRP